MHYDEGLKVGYKWYDAEKKPVLFPFGFGLSYTSYCVFGFEGESRERERPLRFTVKNTGSRPGAEIAEIYAALPAETGEPPKRLVGFSKVQLQAGESKEVRVNIDAMYLSIFDEGSESWKLVPGSYSFMAGGSSQDLPLVQKVTLK